MCYETPLRALQQRAIYSQNTHYRLLLCCDTPLRALQQRSVCATNSKTLTRIVCDSAVSVMRYDPISFYPIRLSLEGVIRVIRAIQMSHGTNMKEPGHRNEGIMRVMCST